MDATQLNSEIQKLIDSAPDKALQNVLDFLKKVRTSSPLHLPNEGFVVTQEEAELEEAKR